LSLNRLHQTKRAGERPEDRGDQKRLFRSGLLVPGRGMSLIGPSSGREPVFRLQLRSGCCCPASRFTNDFGGLFRVPPDKESRCDHQIPDMSLASIHRTVGGRPGLLDPTRPGGPPLRHSDHFFGPSRPQLSLSGVDEWDANRRPAITFRFFLCFGGLFVLTQVLAWACTCLRAFTVKGYCDEHLRRCDNLRG
jgi:hypothetical protein